MTDGANFNSILYMIQQTLNRVSTNTLVEVVSFIPNPGGGLLAGTVNVQPLINQVADTGAPVPHGVLAALPYFRIQAGNSAIVVDPVAGDIGMAAFCDHDISSVIANKAQSNPGSFRRFDMSDGIYFGAVGNVNGAPTQFIEMLAAAGGINITTPATATINAGGKTFTFGSAGFTMSDGIVAETHQHTYTPGSGSPTTTSGPVA